MPDTEEHEAWCHMVTGCSESYHCTCDRRDSVAPYIASLCTSDCRSYNWCVGSVPEVLVNDPHGRNIAIDSCIAPVIQALWDAGIETLGSCCGHGVRGPNIVLESQVNDVGDIRRIIATVTDRTFELLAWKLVAQ